MSDVLFMFLIVEVLCHVFKQGALEPQELSQTDKH